MSDCLFCNMIAGKMPCRRVFEDEQVLAIEDIRPQAPTHLLVIPTYHVASLNDVTDPALLGKLLGFARDVARETGVSSKGYRVVVNTNPDGGQTVFHLHLHVLGGRAMTWPPG